MQFKKKYLTAIIPIVFAFNALSEEFMLDMITTETSASHQESNNIKYTTHTEVPTTKALQNGNSYYTGKVIISATQTENLQKDLPVTTMTINPTNIDLAGVSDLSDVLDKVGGIEISGSERRNGQKIYMRGYGQDAINITLDNVPKRMDSGHESGLYIDPSLLGRAEVAQGPGSTIYGSGTLAGLIALRTVEASDILQPSNHLGGRSFAGYRSANGEYHTGSIIAFRGDNYDATMGLSFRNSGNIDLGTDETLIADDRILNGLAKFNYSLNDSATLRFGIIGYNGEAEEPSNPQSLSATDIVDKQNQTITGYMGFDYNDLSNGLLNFKSQLYWTQTEISETFLQPLSGYSTGDKLSHELQTYGFTFNNLSEFNLGSTEHKLLIGGDISHDAQDAATKINGMNGQRDNIPDAKATYIGIYAQDEISIQPSFITGKLIITPGLRYDHYESQSGDGLHSISESHISPKLGLTYQPNHWLSLYASYAHGFRAPNFGEAYPDGTHFSIPGMGSNFFLPNYDLKPETSDSFELGFGFDA